METVYLNGQRCHTYGTLPEAGSTAPCFNLTGADLQSVDCASYADKRIVLNIFPSLDTDVCAASVRRFNEEASKLTDTVVICVSMDLPFAMKRFCTVEGIRNVVAASAFRSPMFGQKYGVQLSDGPLAGLFARAVVVIDKNRRVAYRELVEEITREPDYAAAMRALDVNG